MACSPVRIEGLVPARCCLVFCPSHPSTMVCWLVHLHARVALGPVCLGTALTPPHLPHPSPPLLPPPSRPTRPSAPLVASSDVWSFGITLWEIATLAQTPYGRMENVDVVERVVEEDYRMPKPPGCPDGLWVPPTAREPSRCMPSRVSSPFVSFPGP